MKYIKLYKASSFTYTPFDDFVNGDLDFLEENGIGFVESASNADIIISQNFKHLKKYFWRGFLGKKFLVWTMEPRFDTYPSSLRSVLLGLIKCRVMNAYTKDVHVSCFSFRTNLIDKKIPLLSNNFVLKNKKVIALMSYYIGVNTPPLIINKHNVDLIGLRSQIGLKGAEMNMLDVYGRGWPLGVSKSDSRQGDWSEAKKLLLREYHFNLCFENTIAYNYMSEKIWDSIRNYCLPIYYGKDTNIYHVFPRGSFIDYSDFETPDQLFCFINEMTNETYIKRMNSCIEIYNEFQEKGHVFIKEERHKMLERIVLNLKKLKNR